MLRGQAHAQRLHVAAVVGLQVGPAQVQ
jgi:hypothetical protein